MNFKLTVLCENTSPMGSRLLGEHGWSVLIETGRYRILFDTGAGQTLLPNARLLNKDLSRINYIVLSHGHYDHTGGLKSLIRKTQDIKIIAHPNIFIPKYSQLPGTPQRNIGLSLKQTWIEKHVASLELTPYPFTLTPGITTTGEIPMVSTFEKVTPKLYTARYGEKIPDELLDDLAIVLTTPKGLVVISGCAHRGIINTLNHARRLFGQNRIYGLIGGLHLTDASDNQINETITALKKLRLQMIGVAHCTGFRATARLYETFGKKVFHAGPGTVSLI